MRHAIQPRQAAWALLGLSLLGQVTCQYVEFQDDQGFKNDFAVDTEAANSLRWCQERGGMRTCERASVLQVLYEPSLRQWQLQCGWRSVVVGGDADQAQFDTMASLVTLAKDTGVPLGGSGAERVLELLLLNRDADARREPVIRGAQSFPVALSQAQAPSPIYMKVEGHFAHVDTTKLCVTIVERPQDCNTLAFMEACESSVLESSRLTEYLGFELPSPSFSELGMPDSNHNHTVCMFVPQFRLVPFRLGRVDYHEYPIMYWLEEAERIGVRTFLNPGWSTLIEVQCVNCSMQNRLVVRSMMVDARCKNRILQERAIAAAAFRENQIARTTKEQRALWLEFLEKQPVFCKAPPRSPCEGYIDNDLGSGLVSTNRDGLTRFGMNSTRRLSASEKKDYFHRRSALCFYPNEAFPNGTLIGFAALRMDGRDLQAFVAFVCFFGVVLPLLCMITALLHLNKQERCKQHLHEVRLLLQREQLEREMQGPTARGGTSTASGRTEESSRSRAANPSSASSSMSVPLIR